MVKKELTMEYVSPWLIQSSISVGGGLCVVSEKHYPDEENEDWEREEFEW